MKPWMWFVAAAALLSVLLIAPAIAQDATKSDADPKTKADKLSAGRFDLMLNRVGQIRVKPLADSAGFPDRVSRKPIFRYSDPARGYVAAAVLLEGGLVADALELLAPISEEPTP